MVYSNGGYLGPPIKQPLLDPVISGSPPVAIGPGPTQNAFGLAPGFVEVLVTGLVVFFIWKFATK